MPTTREFVIASFFLYYDLGVILDAAGGQYVNEFFPSIFSVAGPNQALSFLIVILAPWLIDIAAGAFARNKERETALRSALRPSRRITFYIVAAAAGLGCVALAVHLAQDAVYIWAARGTVGEALGPFVLLLLLPTYILAFYIYQDDSRTVFGRFFLCFLTLCSIGAALPVGERTFILLPLVLVLVFWARISMRRLLFVGACGVTLAALLLPFFKSQETDVSSKTELVAATLNGDFARVPVLEDVLSKSRLIGTRILDYPGAGYVYSALFFVPRIIAPFKGNSTSIEYTAYKTDQSADQVHWGLGVGAIEELLLNFGVLLLPMGLLAYGFAVQQFDEASLRFPVLTAPTRLAAVFFLGYHLPAILQDFGAMAIVALLFHNVFGETKGMSAPVSVVAL
jgi:hypothetical protein